MNLSPRMESDCVCLHRLLSPFDNPLIIFQPSSSLDSCCEYNDSSFCQHVITNRKWEEKKRRSIYWPFSWILYAHCVYISWLKTASRVLLDKTKGNSLDRLVFPSYLYLILQIIRSKERSYNCWSSMCTRTPQSWKPNLRGHG
jgi:hypothetical protein